MEELRFEVNGAGQIILGGNANTICGTQAGFHFGVTWGRHGEVGGMISREEAKRMAEFILEELNKDLPTYKELSK